MQKVLTFELNKKKYVSKPFDFEAFRLTNEKHLKGEVVGVASVTIDSVHYMFVGPEATDDVLMALPVPKLVEMCGKVWIWYNEVLKVKNA